MLHLLLFSNFRSTSSCLWGLLVSLFRTSGDVCAMLESIPHFLYLGDLNPPVEPRHEACCYLRTWTPARLYPSPVDPVAESTEPPSSSQIYACYWTCPSHPCIYRTNYIIKIRADKEATYLMHLRKFAKTARSIGASNSASYIYRL